MKIVQSGAAVCAVGAVVASLVAQPVARADTLRDAMVLAYRNNPALLAARLDEIGIDFAVMYGSASLLYPMIVDDETRVRACRAINRYASAAFEERLLDGLQAAMAAGGEEGPVHAAGLVVVEDVPWPVTDLRVDYDADPVTDLIELWRLWKPQKDDYRVRGIDPTSAPSYGVPGDR